MTTNASMNCLIDRTIAYLSSKGEKVKGIRKYIKERYHISIDSDSIKYRLENIRKSSSASTS